VAANKEREIAKQLQLARDLRLVAADTRRLAVKAAVYFANGGDGVGEAVVGDRFKGQGNARFAPLSKNYGDWKSGKSKELNKAQKIRFGRASRLIDEVTGTRVERDDLTGTYKPKTLTRKILPILVLSGELRAAVAKRQHFVEAAGKDKAIITFRKLPFYAIYHHAPQTAPFPKRSPVEPNAADLQRLTEFIQRHVSLLIARFNSGSVRVAFGDGQARIIA
jgi:hypothetical protein